jgi:hypothetical protein
LFHYITDVETIGVVVVVVIFVVVVVVVVIVVVVVVVSVGKQSGLTCSLVSHE